PTNNLPKLARFAKENRIDLTVIGPDNQLAAGIVDLFEAEGLRVFGPNKKAAQLEASKIFAKELMSAEKIPTAHARMFSSSAEARVQSVRRTIGTRRANANSPARSCSRCWKG